MSSSSSLIPIDGSAWQERGEVVPVGEEISVEKLPEVLAEEHSGWYAEEEPVPFGDRYVLVVALKSPGEAEPRRYYALSVPGEYAAGEALGRLLARPLEMLERTLGPVTNRFKNTWRETEARFVSMQEIADMLGIEVSEAEEMRQKDREFPESVLERGGNPLFVRDEIDQWLASRGREEVE